MKDILEVNTMFMHNIVNTLIEKVIQKYLKNKLNLSNIDLILDSPKVVHDAEEEKTVVSANIALTISDKDLMDLLKKTIWKI